jgi:hypothetical protein
VGDAVVAGAVVGVVADDVILSELDPLPPQALSSRPADAARATAMGREVRVTLESPVRVRVL